MMNIQTVSGEFGGKTLTLETGRLARQADGSVFVSYGDSRVLVTAVCSKKPHPTADFLPLTVEFAERFYAAGKIPGGFLRREGRPGLEATLGARQIDRPIRPLFPEGFFYDTQIIATVMSYDPEADVEVAAAIGASAALSISDIPFNGPTSSCRIGRVNGSWVLNPSWDTLQSGESELEILVSGTDNAIMMVEGGAKEVPESVVLEGVLTAHNELKKAVKLIKDLTKLAGRPKRAFVPATVEASIQKKVEEIATAPLTKALKSKEKQERYALVDAAKKSVLEALVPETLKKSDAEKAQQTEKSAKSAFELLHYNLMRKMILDEKIRIDGRNTTTIRPIRVEAEVLPRPHGSSLFTRGETQVLAAVTLGSSDDEQIIDSIYQNSMRKYMLHYNFPPYSVGETGRFGGQSRREIGHGALAERAVKAILPEYNSFPYTIRIVCETLESNGSSSMGSVCSASMALMSAGVPTTNPVAGIAMGLIKEGSKVAILSDILGDEDHLGDMDFKVAGTSKGITAIQMDIKIEGVDEAIMKTALEQAHAGRIHILGEMSKVISTPRNTLSTFAPRITTIQVPVDKIREVIGSGGKVIREIIAKTGCKIDIEDDGRINIVSNDGIAAQNAIDTINGIIAVPEPGKTYSGIVKRIVDFGAFVQILPTTEGLLHVSEIAHERVNEITKYFNEGDTIDVKVLEVERNGKIRLSRRALLPPPEKTEGAGAEGATREPRSNHSDRAPRGADRPRPSFKPRAEKLAEMNATESSAPKPLNDSNAEISETSDAPSARAGTPANRPSRPQRTAFPTEE